jgi:hypothetical protein
MRVSWDIPSSWIAPAASPHKHLPDILPPGEPSPVVSSCGMSGCLRDRESAADTRVCIAAGGGAMRGGRRMKGDRRAFDEVEWDRVVA